MNVSFLIKPSSNKCNLGCKYCFYKDVSKYRQEYDKGFMTLDTARSMIEKGLQVAKGGSCTFAFQGGEPTLIGLAFYQAFVDIINTLNHDVTIHYAIQTNGTLLDEAWATFFKENKVLVGISLDGNYEMNDLNRVDMQGNSTFKKVMETTRLLKHHDVEFNVLCVINQANVRHAKKIYQYFKQQKFNYLQFIPCLNPLGEDTTKYPYTLNPKAYGEFLCNLYDEWEKEYYQNRYISIRFFDNLIHRILGSPSEACDMNGICSIQHVVEADGSVYPCDFYVSDEWRLGNINDDDLATIHGSALAKTFLESSKKHSVKCSSCPYVFYCRGGCRRHRDALHENVFCESYEIFYGRKASALEKMANYIRKQPTK